MNTDIQRIAFAGSTVLLETLESGHKIPLGPLGLWHYVVGARWADRALQEFESLLRGGKNLASTLESVNSFGLREIDTLLIASACC